MSVKESYVVHIMREKSWEGNLSIIREDTMVTLEIDIGHDGVEPLRFSFDCGDTDEWQSFIRFREELGRLGDAANLKAYEARHPDGEEEDE